MNRWHLAGTYDFAGRSVRYGVRGKGPPVVLVHGTPWSSFNLRHHIEDLSRRFAVYHYDLVGYGRSDKKAGNVSLGIQNGLPDQLLEEICPFPGDDER